MGPLSIFDLPLSFPNNIGLSVALHNRNTPSTMDHQNLNTTGSYKRSYSCALYSDEALFERDNMPLCYPVLNTSHIPSTDKAIECPGPGIYDGILDRDSNIASDATHSRGSAPTLLVQQPTASDKHIPWPSDEIAGYGGMERIYGYPPMLQQQLSYSQKEDQQIRVTCHYNILGMYYFFLHITCSNLLYCGVCCLDIEIAAPLCRFLGFKCHEKF